MDFNEVFDLTEDLLELFNVLFTASAYDFTLEELLQFFSTFSVVMGCNNPLLRQLITKDVCKKLSRTSHNIMFLYH